MFAPQQGAAGAAVVVTVAVAGLGVGKTGENAFGVVRRLLVGLAVLLQPALKGVDARGAAVQSVRDAVRLDGGQCEVALAEAFGRFQGSAFG
jgi:hypothetical protein